MARMVCGIVADMARMSARMVTLRFWQPRRRYGENSSQKAHFEHFGSLATDMARVSLGRLTLKILQVWPQIWPECTSECSFLTFWRPGRRYGENGPEKVHFEHCGSLATDMARVSLGRRTLKILQVWPQIWPQCISECSF